MSQARPALKARLRIVFAVAGLAVEFGGLVALLAVPLGAWRGFLVALAVAAVSNAAYLGLIWPRLARWGATIDEAGRAMPGDGIAGSRAFCSTRAVTVGRPADQVWPWLAQLSDGQASWDSYHLFGAGQRREPGQGQPGSQPPGVLTMPGPVLEVVGVEDGHYFVACTPDAAASWCLDAEPLDRHSCRLISRWRIRWLVTAASAPWGPLADPSSLAADRRMLLGIKARAEQATQPGPVDRG